MDLAAICAREDVPEDVREALRAHLAVQPGDQWLSDKLRALHRVSLELSRLKDVDQVCRRAVELGRERLGFGRLGIWFATDDPETLRGAYGVDEEGAVRDERERHVRVRSGMPLTELMANRGHCFVSEDAPLYNHLGERVGTGVLAGVSMWDGDRVIGALYADSLLDAEPWRDPKLDLLAALAETVGHAVTQCRSREALAESNARLRASIEATDASIAVINPDGVVALANDVYCRSLGRDRGSVEGQRVWDMLPPDLSGPRREFARRMREGGLPRRYQDRRGDRWYAVTVHPVTAQAGQDHEVVVYGHDITEMKAAELEALESRRLARTLIDANPSIAALMDLDGVVLECNAGYAARLGRERSAVVGRGAWDLFSPEAAELRRREFEKVRATKEPARFVDGSAGPLYDTTVSPVLDEAGEVVGIAVFALDVTDRMRAERALTETEERFQAVADLMPALLDAFDAEGRVVFWNAECERVTGYTREEALADPDILRLLYPDRSQYDSVMDAVRRLDADYRDREYELTRKDGERRTIAWSDVSKTTPIAGWHAWGVGVDVTDRSRAEAALAEERARLLSVLDAMPDFICAQASDHSVRFSNRAFRERFGDPVGRKCYEAMRGRPEPCEPCPTFGVFETGEPIQWERVDPDGRSLRIHDVPFADLDGAPLVLEIGTDVTDLRETQESLRRSNSRLESILKAAPVGIGVTVDRVIRQANDFLCRMTGYREEDLVGQSARMLYLSDEEYERVGRVKYGRIRDLGIGTVETRWVRSGGNEIDVLLSSCPVDPEDPSQGVTFSALDVTESNRARDRLIASEARYRGLFESSIDAIVVYDAETGRLVDANDAAADLYGYSRRELLERTYGDISADPSGAFAALGSAAPEGRRSAALRSGRRKDGSLFLAEVSTFETRAGGGARVCCLLRDATDRLCAEEALRCSEQRYRDLFDRMLGAGAVHEMIWDESGAPADYRFLAVNPAFEELTGLKAEDLIGRTVLEVLPQTERFWIETYGAVVRTGEPASFSSYSRSLGRFYEVAAYRNAPGQFACVFMDATERIAAQQALRESEERYRAVVDTSPIGIFVIRAGRFTFANRAGVRMLGRTGVGELVGVLAADVVSERSRADLAAHLWGWDGADGPERLELEIRRPDGSAIWCGVTSAPIALDGQPATLLIARDTTDRRRAERQLRESRNQLARAQRLARMGSFAWDVRTDEIAWSDALYDIMGVPVTEEMTRARYLEIVHPEDRAQVAEALARARESCRPLSLQHRIVRPDGAVRHVHDEAEVEADVDGEAVRVFGATLDITERVRAQEELWESRERFRIAAETSTDLIYEWDVATDALTWHGGVEGALGYGPGELPSTLDEWLARIHPDDRDQIARSVEATRTSIEPVVGEYRIHRKDGSWRCWLNRAAPVLGEDDRPLRWVGACNDITERRVGDEQLRSYQEQLRALGTRLSLVEEQERQRIAAGLHDSVAQTLLAVQLELSVLERSETSPERASALSEVADLLGRAIRETRSLTFDISPPLLYEMGLEAAVEWLVSRLDEEQPIRFEFSDDRCPKPLDGAVRSVLYQCARELLRNVVRHSRARQARVEIARLGGFVHVTVEDDGVGFDPVAAVPDTRTMEHFGLFSVRERIEALGGRVLVVSAPGKGTRATLIAPTDGESAG